MKTLRVTPGRTLATLATSLLCLATFATSANATPTAPKAPYASPTVVAGTTSHGVSYRAQALTLAQVKALGLAKYVNTDNYYAGTPVVTATGAITAVRRAGSSPATTQASGCWSFTSGYKIGNNMLWGQDNINWCGGGTWVSYTHANCHGGSWYPTYDYDGCSHDANYGVGWNLWQVRDTWNFCIVYVPLWGSCVTHQYPWEQYQFLGSGAVLWNGGW